jgi:hypothetical protein
MNGDLVTTHQTIHARQKMTLGNMRANGVRSLIAWCSDVNCRHEAVINIDSLADDVAVPSLGPRMRCQCCGQREAEVMPNWRERRVSGAFDGCR